MSRRSPVVLILSTLVVLLLVQLTVFGCSKNDSASSIPTVSTSVGSQGGTVVSADGHATLTVPPGAVDGDVTITVETLPRRSDTLTPIYDFGPDGLVFRTPAHLTITLDSDVVTTPMSLAMTHGQAGDWAALASSVMGNVLGGDVMHFTGFAGIANATLPSSDGGAVDGSGDGATTSSGPVTQLAGGAAHTCFSTLNGAVQCFGSNRHQQCGVDSGSRDIRIPVTVPGVSDVVALAAGAYHTCALTSSGSVMCWGANANYESGIPVLGDAGAAGSVPPTVVPGLASGVVAINASENVTCALLATGEEKCFGPSTNMDVATDAGAGPLHDEQPIGMPVTGFAMHVSGNGQTQCFVAKDGSGVYCTPPPPLAPNGGGDNGGLTGTGGNSSADAGAWTLQHVDGTAGATEVVVVEDGACALVNGAAMCWGQSFTSQAAIAPLLDARTATPLAGVNHLLAGEYFVCAVFGANHDIACYTSAAHSSSNLGASFGLNFSSWPDGGPVLQPSATVVPGMTGATVSAAGAEHFCMGNGATVSCAGVNSFGRSPVVDFAQKVPLLPPVKQVVSSIDGNSCALTTSGAVWCWPYLRKAPPANPNPIGMPNPIPELASAVDQIGMDEVATCAVVNGGVKCFAPTNGDAEFIAGGSAVPVPVTGFPQPVVQTSGGFTSACAVMNDGTAACWGFDNDGTFKPPVGPTLVPGLTDAAAIAPDNCAITTSGNLKCWTGIGQPAQDAFATPEVVSSMSKWGVFVTKGGAVKVSSASAPPRTVGATDYTTGAVDACEGQNHMCVVYDDGTVTCAGQNLYGQLGRLLNYNQDNPAAIVPGVNAAVHVSCTENSTCAVLQTGDVMCWGLNDGDQMGDGYTLFYPSAVTIPIP